MKKLLLITIISPLFIAAQNSDLREDSLFIHKIAVNILSAEKLDFASVLGYEETLTPEATPSPDEDDLLSFDLYENLNNN